MTSLSVRYCFPAICQPFFVCFSWGKKWSNGAKSGECVGWSTSSKPQLSTAAISPQIGVYEHFPGETSSGFQAVLTWLTFVAATASWHNIPRWHFAFRKVGNEHNTCTICIPEDGSHRLPYHLGLPWRGGGGGGGEEFSTTRIVVWSLVWRNFQENWLDLLQRVPGSPAVTSLVCFWSAYVNSCGTHRAQTLGMPSSLCRMSSTRSREMPRALAIWLMLKPRHPSPSGEYGRCFLWI